MIKCDVIRDLVPLYLDGVSSDESVKLVEAHLENCESCRSYLNDMRENSTSQHINIDYAEIGVLKKMKKKIKKKNIIISVISVAVTLVVIYGLFFYRISLPYNPDSISVNVAEDTVIDIYHDDNYLGMTGFAEGDCLYLSYYGTVATKLTKPAEPLHFAIGNGIGVDYGKESAYIPIDNQINKIYFLDYDSLLLDATGFSEAVENAVLMWER